MKKNIFNQLYRSFALLLILVIMPQQVMAVTLDEANTIYRGSVYYDPKTEGACTPSVQASGSLDRFLQVLAFRESGGNPLALNPIPTASGKYQYLDGTWQDRGRRLYGPAQQYERAYLAPEEVQDAVTYIEYAVKFKDFNNDLFLLAVSHYQPIAVVDPTQLDIVPAGNSLTPRQYGEKFLESLESQAGSDILLHYAQAPDFQTWLLQAGVTDTAVAGTSSGNSCGAAGIPATQFVFYSQYDPLWRDHAYGTSTIAASGCGPSSVAMVVATLADRTITPVEVADWGSINGTYTPSGSSWSMMSNGPAQWGLKVESLGLNIDQAIQTIRAGGLVIASGRGPAPFTDSGHIIVIRGIDTSGKLLLGDPAHPEFNEQAVDSAELMRSVAALWGITK